MMSAEIHAGNLSAPGPSSPGSAPAAAASAVPGAPPIGGAKPELINKLEGGADDVNAAMLIPDHDGVITISKDRSVRVWLLRDSGQYWPSICHYMTSAATALCYHHDTRQLFVGVESGMISEFILADDFNRMDHKRDYHAHRARVTGLTFAPEQKWILSVARDKYFQYHCTDTGRRLGGYLCGGWGTCLEYDEQARYVFIGDFSGLITICKLDEQGSVQLVNTLKGHEGSVQTLRWEGEQGWLFSGSFDASVFVWDIGGRQGTVYELHGHKAKVTAVHFLADQQTIGGLGGGTRLGGGGNVKKTLLSASEDANLVQWDMSVKRLEAADWAESDICQLCSRPYFWNLRAMYEQKQVGLRQHHCRKCGKAVCDSCSTKRCPLPSKGHEFPVRVCEDCYINVTDQEKMSHARFHDMRQSIESMHLDEKRKLLLTVGPDRMVKIWSVEDVI